MITMSQNPSDIEDQIEQAYKMAPPVAAYAAPVDPHAALTVPIGPPAPKPVTMAAGPSGSPKMSARTNELGDALPEATGAPEPTQTPKMSLLVPQEEHINKNLMADYKKDADPYGSADNHPGFLGKFLHGLNVATGGVNRRGFEEQGLQKNLQDLSKEESTEGLQGAETAGRQEETDEAPQKAADTHAQSGATTANLESETNARNNPQPSLAGAYAHAVSDALKNGRDPSTDPIVQHISDAITSIQPEHAAGQPKPVQVNGKSTFAIETPNGWVDAQSRQPIQGNVVPIPPPPNYGQLILPTKTATFIDPKTGLPTEQQWDPKTGTYDKPLGLSASNAYGHEAAQAGAVQRAGTQLIDDIQANREHLGTLSAWVQKHGLDTPIADPTLAGLQAELGTFAALQPSMHGFRGSNAVDTFNKIIGGLQKNPDATIASIQGILKTAGNINPGLNHSNTESGPKRPANVPEGYKFNQNGPKGAGWYAPTAK